LVVYQFLGQSSVVEKFQNHTQNSSQRAQSRGSLHEKTQEGSWMTLVSAPAAVWHWNWYLEAVPKREKWGLGTGVSVGVRGRASVTAIVNSYFTSGLPTVWSRFLKRKTRTGSKIRLRPRRQNININGVGDKNRKLKGGNLTQPGK